MELCLRELATVRAALTRIQERAEVGESKKRDESTGDTTKVSKDDWEFVLREEN